MSHSTPDRRRSGPSLDLDLARSHLETKELKLRRAIELVSEAQRELLAARRELARAERRLGARPTPTLHTNTPPRSA